ncbi:MAG: HAMP domain-containing sensor histidine kinase [Rikenellaceae bacterium]
MTWKQSYGVKIPVYIITLLALIASIVSGAVLLIGYDNGTFTNEQYYGTDSYNSLAGSTLWSYNVRLDNEKRWAEETAASNDALTITEGSGMEYSDEVIIFTEEPLEFETSESELIIDQYLTEVLAEFETTASVEETNFNIRITENATGTVLLDTFGDRQYWPMETREYGNYTIEGALQSPTTVNDEFAGQEVMYYQMRSLFPDIWVVFGVSSFLLLVGLGLIIATAGHRKGKEGVTQGTLEKIPTDLWVVSVTLLGGAAAYFTFACSYSGWQQQSDIAYVVGMVAIASACALVFGDLVLKTVETMAVRVKTHTFWRNTIIGWVCRSIKKGLCALPIIWRTVIISLAIFAVNGFLGMWSMAGFFPWMIFAFYNLLMVVALCALAWQMKLLQTGAEKLANGKLSEKIDTSRMYLDCKKYGETLNTIGDGIGLAVDEKLKSQRMKTELITNVSHDIKTPLTSIVTCVELLQGEHTEEQHREYLDLLQRQSMKMKKLVEDLVEASKASTGNLNVNLEDTDLVEVVEQALGEYVARFEAQNLTVMTTFPESCTAQADGKLLWRVLDNLLSNVCKYAMPSTRVYVTVTEGNRPEIAIKNISAQPLNLTAEELMERFVRGESSRTTEGSGLGLNIAQSLMQLQNGSLKLYIDGDFVRVQLYL